VHLTDSKLFRGSRMSSWHHGPVGSASSVTSPFWARAIKDVELVRVIGLGLPVSPGSDEWLLQMSHVSLTERAETPARAKSQRLSSPRLVWCEPPATSSPASLPLTDVSCTVGADGRSRTS
jgi:hypothetical protein